MTHRLAILRCLICGEASDDRQVVAMGMAHWREPVGGWTATLRPFSSIPRCLNARACRARTEAQGDAWPLDDATPAPVSEARPALATSRATVPDEEAEEAARWG